MTFCFLDYKHSVAFSVPSCVGRVFMCVKHLLRALLFLFVLQVSHFVWLGMFASLTPIMCRLLGLISTLRVPWCLRLIAADEGQPRWERFVFCADSRLYVLQRANAACPADCPPKLSYLHLEWMPHCKWGSILLHKAFLSLSASYMAWNTQSKKTQKKQQQLWCWGGRQSCGNKPHQIVLEETIRFS